MDAEAEGEPTCYVCLSSCSSPAAGPAQPLKLCKCPRYVHAICAARFCSTHLPDYRATLARELLGADSPSSQPQAAPPCAYMRISYNGISHKIKVLPGPSGRTKFVEDCRQLLHIPPQVDFDVVFHCKEPITGSPMSFHTLRAYDAAVTAASLSSLNPQDEEQASTVLAQQESMTGPGAQELGQGGLAASHGQDDDDTTAQGQSEQGGTGNRLSSLITSVRSLMSRLPLGV